MKKCSKATNRLIFTLFSVLLTVTLLSSCSKDTATPTTPTKPETFTDPRDGQVYKVVTIGTQTWMAQNLNYTTGTSWCYDSISSNCTTYGRLYNWQTAKGACPSGWHLPTEEEWNTLSNFLKWGGNIGGKMKSVTGWNSPNTGATNQSGFSALPGGALDNNVGSFQSIGILGYWWTAFDSTGYSGYRDLSYNGDGVGWGKSAFRDAGLSVRCIKD